MSMVHLTCFRRTIAAIVVGTLAWTGLPAAAASASRAATPPAVGGSATEEQRALAEAAETGERVEVVGARTELTTGWRTDEASLTFLASGVPYRAGSMGRVGDRALNGGIFFTLNDVEELGPDDVLVADGGEKNKVMDRDEFLAEGSACSFG
ncbi:hypothetical protein [Streptomyces sp. NPDC051909]|uniref:hypothetical protein n=1 Tax=Streptomyces sp. NPDC051909 TaxID=3154944 RepID=UPI003437855C